ncbi:MAG: prolyl oligopeptidase family serine peptidase [Bacteroidota bacterium]|nr:prolyl oligopeptidase family serine peptidase [Bacteroidota bacterium]
MTKLKFTLLFTLILALIIQVADAKDKKKKKKVIKNAGLTYVKTRKDKTTDNYHGSQIADPYRWLENDKSAETAKWITDQNVITQSFLGRAPYKSLIKTKLTELWNYQKFSIPINKGKRIFYFSNNGLQNQSVLYMKEGSSGTQQTLLDPNEFSTDGTVSLGGIEFNKAGDKMGYIINRSGSDWQEIYVLDVNTKKTLSDKINWAKFSSIAWKGDGFFYSRYDEPKKENGSELSDQNSNQKVYFHKLGTQQSADKLVYQDVNRPNMGWSAATTKDEGMLILYGTEGASTGNELYVSDFGNTPTDLKFKTLYTGVKYNYSVVDVFAGRLLIFTNRNAARYKLVLTDPNFPDADQWISVVPEAKDMVMQNVTTAGKRIIITYMKDAYNKVMVYDEYGSLTQEVGLPSIGTVAGFEGEKEDDELFFSFSSFIYPPTIFSYSIKTNNRTKYMASDVKFNPEDYIVKQVFFSSADGTQVPMFIIHSRKLKLEGNNVTYLYGYGGFNISLNPTFSPARLLLLQQGGVLAVVNLRGGGEYGENWHKAGMLDKKQNVFNDFIAAAQYLIEKKYTSSQKLAIAGGSNGGLLVGACMTQRPDLYKVALPAVGVLDMLRYQKFTIGHAWVPEYGSSDTAAQFNYLIKYSPLHNLKVKTAYPATMVTTADHDDRVVPAHSFKYAATIQEHNVSENPVLIRIDSKAGHGAGKPISKQIDEWTDIYTFMYLNMGFTPDFKVIDKEEIEEE